ncbi:Root cap [Carex littledalei]|uniref:Root cap n=1 Tax=Carex littledalei TaxID=544730 RepID=A0A833RDK0_9POAL|nr:Root cap [Carex littledalei]
MFDSRTFTVEAKRVKSWNETTDHLSFTFDGTSFQLREGYLSKWSSADDALLIERTERVNSVMITVNGVAEISVTVVPVTEQDDRIHGYKIPKDDCFAHLEVQFRFSGISQEVEGVLGRTYQPDYVSTAKRGVEIPVVGGADKYETTSLLSSDSVGFVATDFESIGSVKTDALRVIFTSKMKSIEMRSLLLTAYIIMLAFGVASAQNVVTCFSTSSSCFLKVLRCPTECPLTIPTNPTEKACYADCSVKCEAICRNRKPSCNGLGSGCYDPRFIGGDGVVFYFHGKRDNHYALVSDRSFQINARFIGLRPQGRTRDFTWIQALGLMFASHTFTVEAKQVKAWNETTDQLSFTFDGTSFQLREGYLSKWNSADDTLLIERTERVNSVMITVNEVAEISVSVIPVTEQDDRIHGYNIPKGDCFAHLQVQFRFFGISQEVEGVLGRTYRPDYVTTVKRGVEMPVLGGADEYETTSLLSPDCKMCLFSPSQVANA